MNLKWPCKKEANKKDRKTTSIKVDPKLWKEFKKLCVEYEIDISEYLDSLIRTEVKTIKFGKEVKEREEKEE